MADDRFEAATAAVAALVAEGRLQQAITLRFYGLYKQATEGPCAAPKPSLFDQRGRAKWAAWQELGGMPADAACAAYAALLDEVAPAWDAAAAGAASGTKSSKAMGPVFSSLGAAPDDGDDNGAQGGEGGGELAAAAREGGLERVRALLAAGADCGARDADGCTPLHWAADRGHCEVIRALAESGAQLDARDADGLTPLHYAALADQRRAAEALLAAGAGAALQDDAGQSPADLAPDAWRQLLTSTT